MDQQKNHFVKRLSQILLISLVLFSCVFNSSSSDEKNDRFWQEGGKNPTPKYITPNVFVDISKKVNAAVVNISTVETVNIPSQRIPFGQRPGPFSSPLDEFFRDFFDRFAPREGLRRQSLGSGFILNKEGFIVTNNHVVERADEINVVLSDDESFKATVVGRDPKTDVALIKIEPDKETKLAVVSLGDSDKMRVGDMVVAIGNPFGLEHTLTTGVISAKGRSLNLGQYDDFIQTDASINPGNSGGPLLNINGEVIGINTAINAAAQGIGFAIPINLAKNILTQLKATGKVTRGWLGVIIMRMDKDHAKALGLDKATGAVVSEVQEDSPAAKAKLQRGDVILTFAGKKVADYNDLPRLVADTAPNTEVVLEILRNGKKVRKRVTLGALPENEMVAETKTEKKSDELGVRVQNLTPEWARSQGLDPDDKGVVVTYVDPSSIAYEKGLRRGDLIQEINRTPISNIRDYRKTIQSLDKGDAVIVWFKRRNRTAYFAFTYK